jgi:hypothetical protein
MAMRERRIARPNGTAALTLAALCALPTMNCRVNAALTLFNLNGLRARTAWASSNLISTMTQR